jgi:hypothetical protein
MKNASRKNRKVTRKVKGDFTKVQISLLNDKRLSPTAKLLLIMILSDADDFVYSQARYIKMLNVAKTTYLRAFDELIELGYAKVTKFKDTNFNNYIFSEYGNLKTEEKQVESSTQQKEVDNGIAMAMPNNDDVKSYIDNSFKLMYERIELKYSNTSINKIKAIKNECDKWLNDALINGDLPDEQRIINKVASIGNSIITANRNENQYFQN